MQPQINLTVDKHKYIYVVSTYNFRYFFHYKVDYEIFKDKRVFVLSTLYFDCMRHYYRVIKRYNKTRNKFALLETTYLSLKNNLQTVSDMRKLSEYEDGVFNFLEDLITLTFLLGMKTLYKTLVSMRNTVYFQPSDIHFTSSYHLEIKITK